ncbi:MAG: metallophosphoesterase [Saprospiraceae bacterium]
MKITFRPIFALLLCTLLPIFLFSQIKTEYFDGPYIFHQNDSLQIQWVEAGIGHDSLIAKSEATVFDRPGLPKVDLQNLGFEKDSQVIFNDVEKIIALSDVHGQFGILKKLLLANEVIDENNHWKLGKGHLVIVGDNLDRGDQVLEILWFLFYLQKEAETAGGKVQVLLGNHEIMVLQGDIRYINKKYYYTSAIFKNQYYHFFRRGSVLGDWIASHKVLTSINKNLFVHGGVSKAVLDLELSLEEINNTFAKRLIRAKEEDILKDSLLTLLYTTDGPVWYRGYFKEENFKKKNIKSILSRLDQKRIIVGHTSQNKITALFGGKVIAVDCSIKKGLDGQVLILENNNVSIGDLEGNKKSLSGINSKKRTSLFDHIYNLEGVPKLRIATNFKNIKKHSMKEKYQDGQLVVADQFGKDPMTFKGRVRSRGNMRKQVCNMPPVKFDLKKSGLKANGFMKIDKLKFVFPCKGGKHAQELLYKEYFLYDLYTFIDKNCLRAKLVDINICENGKDKYQLIGFVIEDEVEYERRNEAKVITKGRVGASHLDRELFLKMEFFQYMIANTDWSLANKHNLELVKIPSHDKVIALPYDFDYSGFVGQHYAVPHESLPIKDVNERYFFSYKITEEEFYQTVEYYLSIEEDIYRICDEAIYMSKKTIKYNKAYLKDFFDLLRNPKRLKPKMVKD